MNARFATATVALFAALAPAASAAPRKKPAPAAHALAPRPMNLHVAPVAMAPPRWSTALASENGMRGSMDVAATASLGGVSALAGFRLRFGNGDHELRQVGVLTKDRYATFSLADQNGDDPFRAAASWAVVSGGRTAVVSGIGGGQFEIPLTGKVAGHKPVLTGFEFRRKDGTDANVRSIGVWLDENRNTVRVMLMDDQGPDFRGFERTIGTVLLGGAVPLGEFKATADTMVSAVGMVNRGAANGKYRPFAVTVQYAWIPSSVFASTDVLTGTSRAAASGKVMGQNAVLQGFEFYFGNSDHHLLDVGVMGPMLRPPPSAIQTPAGEVIAYQDNNRDDPIHWAVEYASLKPSP